MRKQEREVILGIEPVLAAEVLAVMTWANTVLLESSTYEATIPSYSDPQVSGKRSVDRQLSYISRGLSWWNPDNVENAPHVAGKAIHIGLRYKKTGRYIPWRRMSAEAKQVFLLIVEKMKSKGWTWGGDWKRKDYEHFQKL